MQLQLPTSCSAVAERIVEWRDLHYGWKQLKAFLDSPYAIETAMSTICAEFTGGDVEHEGNGDIRFHVHNGDYGIYCHQHIRKVHPDAASAAQNAWASGKKVRICWDADRVKTIPASGNSDNHTETWFESLVVLS